jgi:hypothetical protein
MEVAKHLFGYRGIVVTRLGGVCHAIAPCVWEFCLVRGLAPVLATLSTTACLTVCASRRVGPRTGRRAGRRSAALLLLAPVRGGSV